MDARTLWQELLPRPHRRPLGHHYGPIRFSLQGGRIQPQQLPTPPHPGCALFCHAGEPVLPEHRADLSRRLLRKRIAGKKGEHVLVIGKESQLRVRYDRILAPGTQGCEPQVPIESAADKARKFQVACSNPAACSEMGKPPSAGHPVNPGIRSRICRASSPRIGRIDWQSEMAQVRLPGMVGKGARTNIQTNSAVVA